MARRGRPTSDVVLTDEERDTLERWARRPKSSQALALRCRIVLACADEERTNGDIAAELSVTPATVGKCVSASPPIGWTACTTSPDLAFPGRSPMTTLSASS